jgi:hypothetical protein
VPLVPFSSVDRSALRWLRSQEEPVEFTLSAGDRPVATLRSPKQAHAPSVAETVGQTWYLEKRGFLNPHLTLHDREGGPPLARVSVHLNYHRIEVTGGANYRFHRAGLLVPAWQITSDDGTELAHLEPARETRRLEGGAVLVTPRGVASKDLLALLLLSWFFIVTAWFEDEAMMPLEDANFPPGPRDAAGIA